METFTGKNQDRKWIVLAFYFLFLCWVSENTIRLLGDQFTSVLLV